MAGTVPDNDIADLKAHKPGLVEATVEWFKYYKVLVVSFQAVVVHSGGVIRVNISQLISF